MSTFAIIGIVLAVLLLVVLVLLWGFLFKLILPKRYSAVGDKVSIFLDGIYNREATITGIGQEKVVIYETLPLPLEYRNKFYAVGCDSNGVEIWYMADKSLYWLVPYAERIRKRYKVIDCRFNFVPVEEQLPVDVVEESEAAQEEGADGDKEQTDKEQAAEEGADNES